MWPGFEPGIYGRHTVKFGGTPVEHSLCALHRERGFVVQTWAVGGASV